MKKKEYMTKIHKIIELGAWICWMLSLVIAIYGTCTLPNTIATHFTIYGEADGYGSPGALLILPIIMFFCLGICSLVIHLVKPEYWNIPFQVKEKNKVSVYKNMLLIVVLLELEIAIFTLYSEIRSYQQSGKGMLGAVGIFMIFLAVTIVSLCIKAYKQNQK